MKSLMTASAVAMSLGLTIPASAQDSHPTSPQNSPLAQATPAQRDPGRQSPLAAAAADTNGKAGSAQIMNSVPPQSVTITDWYKQSVYDPSNNKIGEIKDVVLSQDGKVNALIIGVGGFLAMGEKDVAVPFDAVKHTTKDGKVYLTLNTTKDALKAAPGLRYDRSTTTWVPDKK
jgi:sporulation protein YlmC with PRC-barrel domain